MKDEENKEPEITIISGPIEMKCPFGCGLPDVCLATLSWFEDTPMEKGYIKTWLYWYDLRKPKEEHLHEWWDNSWKEILPFLNDHPEHMEFGVDETGIWCRKRSLCGYTRKIQADIKKCNEWNFFRVRVEQEEFKEEIEKKEKEIWNYVKALAISLESLRGLADVSNKSFRTHNASMSESFRKESISSLVESCLSIMRYIVKLTKREFLLRGLPKRM